MFPCLYLDVSQFYIINILIRKFVRETQSFTHIWNYKLTFKICFDTDGKTTCVEFHAQKKIFEKTFVSSAKCSIY